jgi:antitoxin component of RelBE/YafQ-DinJ toxin-antitoxin module
LQAIARPRKSLSLHYVLYYAKTNVILIVLQLGMKNMSTRSVRLDDEAEGALAEIVNRTGLSISDAIKQGLITYREKALTMQTRNPSDFFNAVDLGDETSSIGPARNAKEVIKNKLRSRLADQ